MLLVNVLFATSLSWTPSSAKQVEVTELLDTYGAWMVDVQSQVWRALQGDLFNRTGVSTLEGGWAILVEAQNVNDHQWKMYLQKKGENVVEAAFIHIPGGLRSELLRIASEHGQISWEETAEQVRFVRRELTGESCPAFSKITAEFEQLRVPVLSDRQSVFHPPATYTVHILGPSHIPRTYEVHQGEPFLAHWCEKAIQAALACAPANK